MLASAIRLLAITSAIAAAAFLAISEPGLLTGLVQPRHAAEAAAPAAPARPKVGNAISIRADASGHYLLTADVNGTPIRFVVDTGATTIALIPPDARAAGLDPEDLRFSGRSMTAAGPARHAPVTLREVRIGALSVRDVDAIVLSGRGSISLLGMNFLSQLDAYEIRDGVMTLWW